MDIVKRGFSQGTTRPLQKMKCDDCLHVWRAQTGKLRGHNRMKLGTKRQILSLLVEGCGTRAISRLTGVSVNSVGKLLLDVGSACLDYQDKRLVGLQSRIIQCDELWTYVGRKARRCWVWVALDQHAKLITTWWIGDRSLATGNDFMSDLAGRVPESVKVVTDGFNVYSESILQAFSWETHRPRFRGESTEGTPASTNHVEAHNGTMRASISRLGRSTKGFSKKPEYLAAHLSIYVMYYNFVRQHRSTRVSPAMEAGLEKTFWSLDDLLALCDARLKPITVLRARISPQLFERAPPMRSGSDHAPDDFYKVSKEWKSA